MNDMQLKGMRMAAEVLHPQPDKDWMVVDLKTRRIYGLDLSREDAEDWLEFFPEASTMTTEEWFKDYAIIL